MAVAPTTLCAPSAARAGSCETLGRDSHKGGFHNPGTPRPAALPRLTRRDSCVLDLRARHQCSNCGRRSLLQRKGEIYDQQSSSMVRCDEREWHRRNTSRRTHKSAALKHLVSCHDSCQVAQTIRQHSAIDSFSLYVLKLPSRSSIWCSFLVYMVVLPSCTQALYTSR